jgi:tetratricopeptide (TPR) repeat protein
MTSRASAKPMKRANGAAKWGKEKTRNGKSPIGSNGDSVAAVEKLLEKKDWSAAQSTIHEALVFHPSDHWLWMHLGLCYYEQRQYEKGLKCAEHAVQLAPDCPLALWHYAGSLAMAGRASAALTIWTALLNIDLDTVAYGEHGEGMDWALQLVNDVHFHGTLLPGARRKRAGPPVIRKVSAQPPPRRDQPV